MDIRLNGRRAFRTTRRDPQPIGAWLDFLSPGLRKGVADRMVEMETKLGEKLGGEAVSEDLDVADVVAVRDNVIVLKILPHLLSPLFPEVAIEHVGVDGGMLQVFLAFPEES